MKNAPLISVIIPAFNAEKYLARAINSVLKQKWPNLEIIVVDDGSRDGTKDIISDFESITYLYQANQGPAAARNSGIEKANGSYLAFLDSDDEFPSDKFQKQYKYLKDNKELSFVAGHIKYLAEKKEFDRDYLYHDKKKCIGKNWHLGSCLFDQACFSKVGGFNPDMKHSEDVDWWLRAVEISLPYEIMEEVTLIYHLHGENMTNDKQTNRTYYLLAMKRSLDRRRNLGKGQIAPLPEIFDLSKNSTKKN